MRLPLLVIALIGATVGGAPCAAAQEPATPAADPAAPSPARPASPAPGPAGRRGMGEWSLGAWAGGAPTSYAGHFIGATPDLPIALVGVRLGSTRWRLGPVGMEYVAQVIPAAFAYDTPVAPLSTSCAPPPVIGERRPRARAGYCRRRVYGAGAMPAGVQLNAPIGRWVQGFAGGGAGVLLFTDNVPLPQARRMNLAFDFGAGLEVGSRRRGALTLGYKLHHISNAWTAQANPGIDHHVFYAGFVREVRPGRRPPVQQVALPAPADSAGGTPSVAAPGR